MRIFPGALLAPMLAIAPILANGLPGVTIARAGPSIAGESRGVAPSAISRQEADSLTLEELRSRLDPSDHVAALHALHMALNQTADGGAFIWEKNNRDLKGVIKPTAAFRNAHGQICRHVIYAISLGRYRKQIELVACREAGGRWRL